jgi:hypothetical protein
MRREMLPVAVAVLSSVPACAPGDRPTGGAATEATELSAAALRNASYPLPYVEEADISLIDGKFEDVSRRIVTLFVPEYAVGDMDDDGLPDAAVVLSTNTGGSGVFQDLAAVLNRDGRPASVATAFLGDRVPVDRIFIVEGEIHVDLTVHGPGDAMCCPTLSVTRRFRLSEDALRELEPAGDAPDRAP